MRFAIAGLILASASGDTKVSPWEWDAPKGSMDAYLKPKYDEALAWKKKPDWSKSIDWAGDEEKDAKWGKQIDALDKEMLKDATTWTTPAPGTPIVMTAAEKAVLGDHPSLLQVKDTPLEAKMHAVEAKLRRAKDKLDREQAEQEVNAPAEASSFAEVRKTADSPDDGFAKVEAKLKALEEKMKSDAAKFEAEAKAPASSFIQTKDAPDDGFAKVEAKLKALEEKMKSDAAKFEAEAKAPSSFAQLRGDGDDDEDAASAMMAREAERELIERKREHYTAPDKSKKDELEAKQIHDEIDHQFDSQRLAAKASQRAADDQLDQALADAKIMYSRRSLASADTVAQLTAMVPDDAAEENVTAPTGMELLAQKAEQDVEGKRLTAAGQTMVDLMRGLQADCAVQSCGYHVERCSEQNGECKKRVACAIGDIKQDQRGDINNCWDGVKWSKLSVEEVDMFNCFHKHQCMKTATPDASFVQLGSKDYFDAMLHSLEKQNGYTSDVGKDLESHGWENEAQPESADQAAADRVSAMIQQFDGPSAAEQLRKMN